MVTSICKRGKSQTDYLLFHTELCRKEKNIRSRIKYDKIDFSKLDYFSEIKIVALSIRSISCLKELIKIRQQPTCVFR